MIALEGMRFYAYHGFYPEERRFGNEFIADIYIHLDYKEAANTDSIKYTVNYENIYSICKKEMKQQHKLLETVAQRIAQKIKDDFKLVSGIKVRITKLNPQLGGQVGRVYVESVL